MKHSRLGASVRLQSNLQPLNCRVGRVISIPEPIGANPLATIEMLDDIPPLEILIEAFGSLENVSHNGEVGRVLDFVRR